MGLADLVTAAREAEPWNAAPGRHAFWSIAAEAQARHGVAVDLQNDLIVSRVPKTYEQ